MNSRRIGRREWMELSVVAAAGAIGVGCNDPVPPQRAPKSPFADSPDSDRPNIVIFLADTLRADHLSCYGRTPQTSPVVDELASEGVLFERSTSGSTWTKPSIGTMFTGVPARVHQAVASLDGPRSIIKMEGYHVQFLRKEFRTLAEELEALGYTSAHFVGNAHARPEFGYGRGFDHVVYQPGYYVGAQIADAIRWIWNEAREPFFVMIHQADPHGPYTPSDEDFFRLHRVEKKEARGEMATQEIEVIQRFLESYTDPSARAAVQNVSPEGNRYLAMLYDAEIFTVDHHFRRLVNHLKRIGVFDHTVMAFTSDHGEGFREHGFFAHGASLSYQELVHVPLVMAGGGLPKGVRVSHSTSMIDLYPTLLELAGGTAPDYVTGTPMISRSGEVLVKDDRLAYTDLDYHVADLAVWDASVVVGRYKVASHRAKNEHWIFDLMTDPGEHDNLAGAGRLPGDTERRLIASLEQEVERFDTLRQQFGEPVWMIAADSVQEELEAMGYL